jgi:hypothetical protein
MAHILTTYSVINGEFEESFRSTLSIKLVMSRQTCQ